MQLSKMLQNEDRDPDVNVEQEVSEDLQLVLIQEPL
jgi:hypothetical protein